MGSSISDVSVPENFHVNESFGSNHSGTPVKLSTPAFPEATNISPTTVNVNENLTSLHFPAASISQFGQTSVIHNPNFSGSQNYHSQSSHVQFSANNPFLQDLNDSIGSQEFEGFVETDLQNLAQNIQSRWHAEPRKITESSDSFPNFTTIAIPPRHPILEPISSEPSNLQNILHRKRIDKTIYQTSKIPIRALTAPTTAQTFTTSSISSIRPNVMTTDELSKFVHQSGVTTHSIDSPSNRSTSSRERGYYFRKSRIPFKLRTNPRK